MGAVVMAVGGNNRNCVLLSCINIVIAPNAGGAFSPFGDITTLMVWQKSIHATNGIVDFWVFFALFVPSLVNWLVPTIIISFSVPNEKPKAGGEVVAMRRGALSIVALFLFTITLAVCFHSLLQLSPVIGMLTGLSLLQLFAYYLKMRGEKTYARNWDAQNICNPVPFDTFRKVSRAEWDTLFFFYGVVMCVGGLGFIGYLGMISQAIYGDWGATNANIAVGVISAIVDNIQVMFAVLSMMPDMSVGQWLMVTLTAGVGGSLLSIGSTAGVALMGQARSIYTFVGHLKWTPVITLGYAASIGVHMAINYSLL